MEKKIPGKFNETVSFIRKKTSLVPKVGIILGSGLGRLAEGIEEGTAFPFDALPHFSAATVEGHPGNLILGRFAGT
ncbi:MAG: purine-nucleoside phosphorylase, partial [Endomicrobiales bacterium]